MGAGDTRRSQDPACSGGGGGGGSPAVEGAGSCTEYPYHGRVDVLLVGGVLVVDDGLNPPQEETESSRSPPLAMYGVRVLSVGYR